MERIIISEFITIKSSTVVPTAGPASEKTELEIFISIINWGMIKGKPIMAIIAAFCCALAAMAARNVNTRLKPHPPKNTRPIKVTIFSTGLPRNKINNNKLKPLITSMSMELKRSFDKTKFWGLVMD